MTDHDAIMEPASATMLRGASKAGWFAFGALTATLIFGMFMFANNYLSTPVASEPETIIEAP